MSSHLASSKYYMNVHIWDRDKQMSEVSRMKVNTRQTNYPELDH